MSYFIVLDGIDGAGTTSQSKRLVENLRKVNRSASFTFEPSDSEIGKFIRNLFTRDEPMPNWGAMALLFSADRMHHVDKIIIPALEREEIIISDRYYYSTLGYQTYLSGLNHVNEELIRESTYNWLMVLNKYAVVPDLTFIIDIPLEVSQARLGRDLDQFERKNDLQTYLVDYYRNLHGDKINNEVIIHVDGTKSKDEVEEVIWNHTKDFINTMEGSIL